MYTKKKHFLDKTSQQYDTSLKGWVKNQPAQILPQLLPGAAYQEAIDIERIKPPMRVDRVFKILYRDMPHIFHVEFESGADTKMPSRLLVYNSLLYHEYELPVISMIVYPFRTTMAISPLAVLSREEEVHRFHFRTLPLFRLEAERYLQEHLTCMYPLLPAMHGANTAIIAQAMAELARLYREDETTLAQEFTRMQVLLERTTTISDEEKATMGEKLKMYDPLWEEHPRVKKIKAQAKAEAEQAKAEAEAEVKAARAKAEAEAKAKAEAEVKAARAEAARAEAALAAVKAELAMARAEAEVKVKAQVAQDTAKKLQKAMVYMVKARFPELVEMAEQRAGQIESADVLGFLLDQIESATSEAEARGLLRSPAA